MKAVMRKTLLAAVLATTAAQAMAADSLDVKVTGQIIPTACMPALSGGATFDYGIIKADTIAADDFTVLPVKSLDFTITCDAPAKVGVMSADMRKDSIVRAVGKNLNGSDITSTTAVMGLGLNGTKGIGSYAMVIAGDVKLDGSSSAVDAIYASTDKMTWAKHTSNAAWLGSNESRIFTWANAGELTPKAFTTLSGTVNVQAAINKGSELNLNQAVTLDGLSTISLYYL